MSGQSPAATGSRRFARLLDAPVLALGLQNGPEHRASLGWNERKFLSLRVSSSGGWQQKWRGDGKELFYLTPGGALMAVDVREGTKGPEVGIPMTLIPAHVLKPVVMGPDTDDYPVSADGERFLVKRAAAAKEAQRIHVLLNWPSLVDEPDTH